MNAYCNYTIDQISESGLLPPSCARPSRAGLATCRHTCRRTGSMRLLPARRRSPLRALLGHRRAPTLPALRTVLLPGHRILHCSWAEALRGRRPRRTQSRSRPFAGENPLRSLDRGSPLSHRSRRFSRPRAPTHQFLSGRAERTRALPQHHRIARVENRSPGGDAPSMTVKLRSKADNDKAQR